MRYGIRVALAAASLLIAPVMVAHAKDVGQDEKIVIQPANGKVGTRFVVSCKNFPEPADTDVVYIVPAGTPDTDLASPEGHDIKVLWRDYASTCAAGRSSFNKAGPFAPGAYEVRFQTTLYNNDKRGEIATRTTFTVK